MGESLKSILSSVTIYSAVYIPLMVKMKAICEGRKTQREVIEETIQQYRAVYMRTQQRLDVLKAVRQPFPSLAFIIMLILDSRSESMCSEIKPDESWFEVGIYPALLNLVHHECDSVASSTRTSEDLNDAESQTRHHVSHLAPGNHVCDESRLNAAQTSVPRTIPKRSKVELSRIECHRKGARASLGKVCSGIGQWRSQ